MGELAPQLLEIYPYGYLMATPTYTKPPAYAAFLKSQLYYGAATIDPQYTGLYTTQAYTAEEEAAMRAAVAAYVDPAEFLMLNTTIPDTLRSKTTSSTTPEVVQTFIYCNNNFFGNATFNSIKTIFEYTTSDVSLWSTFTGSLTVTYDVYCYTRGITLSTNTIDLTDLANTWKTAALNLETGPRTVFRSFMIEGMRHVVADYDCLWNYIVGVSDPKLSVTIHAKQMLYYDII